MTLPDEIWVNQKTNTYHTQERSITTRSHASPRVKYVRADAAPKVDAATPDHGLDKVREALVNGMKANRYNAELDGHKDEVRLAYNRGCFDTCKKSLAILDGIPSPVVGNAVNDGEALRVFEEAYGRYKSGYCDGQKKAEFANGRQILIMDHEAKAIRAALTAPIEQVEGLDEALECVFEHEHDAFKKKYGRYPHDVTNEAARLYAQGRTQSAGAVEEVARAMMETVFHDIDVQTAPLDWTGNDVWGCDFEAMAQAAIDQLSAAPPVTAPIEKVDGWLPIETAPKDGTRVLVKAVYFTNEFVYIARNWKDTKGGTADWQGESSVGQIVLEPTHWQPLPSARLQLQRQGD